MDTNTRGEATKQLWTKQEIKTRPLSRNRLKSYFTHLHHSAGYHGFEDSDESKAASEMLDETAEFEPDVVALCSVMRNRLLKYPDKPLTVQHYGPLLRILEHCQNLTSILAGLEEKKAPATLSGPVRAQWTEQERVDSTHCSTCSCSTNHTRSKVSALERDVGQTSSGLSGGHGSRSEESVTRGGSPPASPATKPLLSLVDLEPPRPSFRPGTHGTLSQGSSDYSSNSGDLLPDEEEELNFRATMARELVETIAAETGSRTSHLYSAVLQTLSRFPISNSSPTTKAKIFAKTQRGHLGVPMKTQTRGSSKALSSIPHRRTFSFLPGDDLPIHHPYEIALAKDGGQEEPKPRIKR